MTELAVSQLNKYYGVNHVLKGLSFEIYKGEKVGLLGKNGSGKTTLFRILTKQEPYEEGAVQTASGSVVEMLEQIPSYPAGYKASDVISAAFSKLDAIMDDMRDMEASMQAGTAEQDLKAYGRLQIEFEQFGGYTRDYSIEKVCNGLGINPSVRNTEFELLSGGEKTRVNLARILLMNPDILLLDEPTNHLDMNAVEWLEGYLSQYKGTMLIVSHDRYFLDRTIDRIIEIVDGRAEFFDGNYSYYVKEKQERLLTQTSFYEQQQKKIKHLEEAAERMHIWGTAKMHRRAFAVERRIEQIDKVDRPRKDKKLKADFKTDGSGSRNAIQFINVNKSFGQQTLLDSLNFTLYNNERVAIIGNNGTGKTTLLRLVTGEEAPDRGTVRIGPGVKYIYVPQAVSFDDEGTTVLDTVRGSLVLSEEKARNLLAAFHFRGDDVFKKVGSLSGGEKSRLKLCLLMQSKCNMLLLDEPTNHLDIMSREWIEEAVSEFDGTIVFVSHDRYFINRFATRIIELENGKVIDFRGDFKRYCIWKMKTRVAKADNNCLQKKNKRADYGAGSGNTRKTGRKADGIQKTQAYLEADIRRLEESISLVDEEMQEASYDYQRLQELTEKRRDLAEELEILYNSWYDGINKV